LNIGIYQGRLTNSSILQKFPSDWAREFKLAKLLGYHHIELFLEKKINLKNPFWRNKKNIINKINQLKNNKVIICDNYLIYNSILKNKNIKYVKKLIIHASKFPKSKLIIPLYQGLLKKEDILIKKIINILKFAKNKKVEISFECDFNSKKVIYLSQKIKNNFKVTFDTGNVFLIEKNLNISFKMLKPLINHIHIKDRNKFKMNVVLGTGIINFKSFFRLLKKLKYNRDITLETNRGCDAISTGYRNLVLVEKLMKS
jgi:sugar phosphate isomerase/epimerase